MKKSGVIGVFVISLLVLSLMICCFSLSFVSANWFSDFWGKITGKVIVEGSNLITNPNFNSGLSPWIILNPNTKAPTLKEGSISFVRINITENSSICWRKIKSNEDANPGHCNAIQYLVGNQGINKTFKAKARFRAPVGFKGSLHLIFTPWTANTPYIYTNVDGTGNWIDVETPAMTTTSSNYQVEVRLVSASPDVPGTYTDWTNVSVVELSESPNVTCTDSDGGLNYYVKGDISVLSGSRYIGGGSDCCSIGEGNSCVDSGDWVQEKFCDNSQSVGYNARWYQCPNGCSNGACVNASQNQTTCTDSDVDAQHPDGKNYYVKGSVNKSGTIGTDCCKAGSVCAESSNIVAEAYCENPLNSSLVYFNFFNCPNGCVDGACVNATEPSPSCQESYKTKFVNIHYDVDRQMYYTDVKQYSGGEWEYVCMDKTVGDTCFFGNIEMKILSVQKSNVSNYVGFSLNEGGIIDYSKRGDNYVIINNSLPYSFSTSREDYVVLSYCGLPQVCQSLINKIKNPTGNEERRLTGNGSYIGTEWVNGKEERYNQYWASWQWNNPEYKDGAINYYYVDYNVQIFDNKNVDLSESASWSKTDPACKANSYWVNDKENTYFICNWDAVYGKQDIDNNKNNHRQIFWYNGNVVVRMYIYYGQQLTDAEVARLSQQRINDLISSLENNQYKYIDWSNFNIDWPPARELYDTIQECGSDVRFNWSEEYLSWNCKTEPVICPPHGYQTQICVAWSQKENQEIKRENQISCSPGICAGCMTPRWLGGNENKCIPYGFRFMQKAQWEWGLIKEIVDQDPLSVAGALNEEDLGLEVYPNQTALLYVGDWNATFYLQIGAIIDITPYLDKYFGENIESTMTVDEILYDSVDYNNSKIIVTFTFREYGSKIVVPEINLYCDIDGWVKQQKTKEGSEWAKCQNNYECESNICSYGECVDLKGIVEQANVFKGTFIKVVCKLSNLFDIDDYSQCVWKYLGEEVSTTASSGGGSGGGSSGGSSPPSMPN